MDGNDTIALVAAGAGVILLLLGFALGYAARGWRCICKDSYQPIYVTPGATIEQQPERPRHRHRDLDEPTSAMTRRRLSAGWRDQVR